MGKRPQKRDYFKASQLVILVCYTIFSVLLIAESFLMKWEGWALILVSAGLLISWILHIRQAMTSNVRVIIYAILMLATAFFYGTHLTSTYDLGLVMSVLILIFISTGIPALITLCQITYYITIAYDVYQMIRLGESFDSLVISRTALHVITVTVICYIARGVIKKWIAIMDQSEQEKEMLADTADRLNDFLANISHELRTPINAVIGLSGVCMEKEDDESIKKDLLSISDAGKRVGDQISDILDYSEIDMDKLAVNSENYMLDSLLNDIIQQINAHRAIDLELVIDVDPSIPLVMNTDVGKLKKIIRHLIDNGLKYTKEGGVYVHFTSEKRDYGINLCIEVTDTGIGMSKTEMERVFDRFFQADSGRTRSTSGLGLGLSIVYGFARSLNGFLTLESELGKGTCVRVSLPQKVVDDESCMSLGDQRRLKLGSYLHFEKYKNPHVREFYNAMVRDLVIGLGAEMQRADNLEVFKKLADQTKYTHVFVGREEYEEDPSYMDHLAESTIVAVIADASFTPDPGSRIKIIRKPFYCFPVISVLQLDPGQEEEIQGRLMARGVKTLVVDDEPMNHVVARGIFARYGMEVFNVDSGAEAIEFVRNNEVDIIFMDHMMPGMDGVEAMKRIRSVYGKERQDVPIVALTANAVSTAKEMFLKEGFDGFVAKPIELAELERVLKKVLPKAMITIEKDSTAEDNEVKKNDEGSADPEQEADNRDQTGGEIKTGKDEKTELYAALKDQGVDVATGLHYSQNDEEFYRQLLEQYASDAVSKRSKIEEYLKEKAFGDYEILIHSVKSTSKMIGAMELFEKARTLEEAAGNKDEDRIKSMHADTMEQYEVLAAAIRKQMGIKEDMPEGPDDSGSDEGDILEFDAEGGDGV